MNRLEKTFKNKKPFIAYLTAGDGGLEYSEKAFLHLVKGGVDILEIGIPFSDPIADGPVIQKAMTRALDKKITLNDILKLVKRIRSQTQVPIILFSYYNPILQAGDAFIKKAKEAGVDGMLIVDLPLEESEIIQKKLLDHGLSLILLIAPSTSKERIRKISQRGSGFLYYVAQKGTTGMRESLPSSFSEKIELIKKETTLPVVAGFGISNKKTAEEFLKVADGFVIGSFFVNAVEKKVPVEELEKLARNIAQQEVKEK
jgi:tryptophan synthase alpha chain